MATTKEHATKVFFYDYRLHWSQTAERDRQQSLTDDSFGGSSWVDCVQVF